MHRQFLQFCAIFVQFKTILCGFLIHFVKLYWQEMAQQASKTLRSTIHRRFVQFLCNLVMFCEFLFILWNYIDKRWSNKHQMHRQFCAILCHVVPCCAILCHFVPFCAILCHFVPFCTILLNFLFLLAISYNLGSILWNFDLFHDVMLTNIKNQHIKCIKQFCAICQAICEIILQTMVQQTSKTMK